MRKVGKAETSQKMLRMNIDLKPMSINKAWRGGRRFRTKDYLQYEKDLLWLLPRDGGIKFDGEFEVDIIFYCKNKLSDADNIIKPIMDILTKSGIIKDDRFAMRIQVTKVESLKDSFEISLYEMQSM